MQNLAHRGTTHNTAAPPLELRGVSVTYTGSGGVSHHALQDVSFQLREGEQVAVVGPNGAGKSTLFKLVTGIITPDAGSIEMYGHAPDRHICIGYVPQSSQIDRTFPASVEDVVMMGRVRQIGLFRRARRQDWDVVRASLERVGASALADKQLSELSGGQQQRVFIARALAQQAELLLLDEPMAGLDMPSQESIFAILDDLRRDHVTVLVATHDLSIAGQRFERVMLLNRRVVAFGPAAEVLTSHNLLTAYGGHEHAASHRGFVAQPEAEQA